MIMKVLVGLIICFQGYLFWLIEGHLKVHYSDRSRMEAYVEDVRKETQKKIEELESRLKR